MKKIICLLLIIPLFMFAYYFPPGGGTERISTQITYQGDLSGQYSDSVVLEAELLAAQQGVNGREVSFILETQEVSAITNSQGIASAELVLNQGAGNYTLLTIFSGDDYFYGSSDSKSFEIFKEDTQLEYTGPFSVESGATVVFTARLSEMDEEVGDLSGKRIIFTVDDQTSTATTNADGIAEKTITLSGIPAGEYDLSVNFEGDALYLPSSDLVIIEVTGSSEGTPSGCFIATAAYGFEGSEVDVLQRFRDQYLLNSSLGQQFVSEYYHYSPGFADFIRDKEFIKRIIRLGLDPLAKLAQLIIY